MAIDETLFENQRAEDAQTTLRFYSWTEPAVTIGYFQKTNETAAPRVVRRLTGGGSVYHGEDLTFSLTGKYPSAWISSDARTSYLKIHEILRRALRQKYPALEFADCRSLGSARGKNGRICFENPACHDLLLNGKKVVGASQRRSKGVLLHQSALYLKEEPKALSELLALSFAQTWGMQLRRDRLTEQENFRANMIRQERYTHAEWAKGF